MLWTASLGRFVITAAAMVLLARPASADFKSLVARVPSDANAIVLIDVERVLNSPLGVREGWKAKLQNAYAQKPLIVPPDASRVVTAACIDPSNMETAWEVSVMDLAKPPSLDAMARAEGGYVDKFGQFSAVWSPINAYFIQLDPRTLGAVCPANRQFASRWAAKKPASPSESLSTYLSNAAAMASAETLIVMAMDLQDVTSASKARRRMATDMFAALEGKSTDLDAMSQVFGSLRGVTLRVALGDEATGKGIVDFDRATAILASFAKPLLLELLSQTGALVDDFETWQVSAKGKQVAFEGKLSSDGLRRLLSVVQPPSPGEYGQPAPIKTGAGEKDSTAAASLQYYRAVKAIIQSLDEKTKAGRSSTLAETAVWMKRDARAISRLPIAGVDESLVQFAADASVRLNEAARIVSEGVLQTQARLASIHDNDRASGKSAAGTQRRQAVQEEKAKAIAAALEVFRGMKAAAEKMRLELTSRYQVEF